MNVVQMLNAVIESVGNRLVDLDPDTGRRVDDLEGKTLCLCILNEGGERLFPEWTLSFENGTFRLLSDFDGSADVTLSGTIPVFARLAFKNKIDQKLTAGELKISGDIELGQQFQRLVEQLDIDWEEQVARIIGDIPARQFGNLMRATLRWQSQSAAILGQDIAEYLQEESHELVTRVEVESFLRDVDTLRADAERLEQRVMRLREISDDTV